MNEYFQQHIERSVYEQLRLGVVSAGYTPDITLYENTPQGWTDYNGELKSIQEDLGFSIEIFNQSNPKDKGIKKVPRLVLTYDIINPGDWGNEPGLQRIPDNGSFKLVSNDLLSSVLTFSCHVIAETTSQLRKLSFLVDRYLPNLSFVNYYFDQTDSFLVEQVSASDITEIYAGVMEKIYTFEVPDIILNDSIDTGDTVPPISEINLNTKISDYLGLTLKIQ